MTEEIRDSSIFVLGILIAAALALYGLWIEGNPTVVEIVELVTNEVYEFLEPKIITRVDKQIIYMTATPGPSVDTIIYGTPIPQLTTLDSADVVSTLRALTPVAPTEVPAPTEVAQYLSSSAGQAPTVAPAPTEVVEHMPTAAPAPPEIAQQAPAIAPEQPTAPPTVAPTNTQVPPTVAPTNTLIPPTLAPTNTAVPTTIPPTVVPPTNTPAPPPTLKPLTPVAPVLVTPELVEENPEEITASSGMATLQGRIDFIDEEGLTLILTNGDYFSSFDLASDGEFWFENVPNGTYRLSVNGGSGGDTCAEITISVPEGHTTLTYNYRFYKMQCTTDL